MPNITFNFPVAEIWLSEDDFDGYETEEFEYEYDIDILQEELIKAFADDYGISIEVAKKIAEDFDLYDSLEDSYYDDIEDSIRDRLYDDAYEAYTDCY